MSNNNVKCVICGKEYKYCHDCRHTTPEAWKASFCCENCREIYRICSAYGMEKITKDEAKKRLEQCNLDEFKKFSASTKKIIREIQREENTTEVKTPVKTLTESLSKPLPQRVKAKKR